MNERLKSIAVIGGGVSGIVSAYLLSTKYNVTLIERNTRLGGHTNTITIDQGPDRGTQIDTGFIVCNDRTYPNFHKFLAQLGVPVRDADMSFGYYSQVSGLQYAGTGTRGLFAQKRNLICPSFLSMIYELLQFNKQGIKSIEEQISPDITLREYISSHGYSDALVRDYLVPMGAAIWSSPDDGILDFPASTFLHFFRNHGLLTLNDRPQWQTVVGGSRTYVDQFRKVFEGKLITGESVETLVREDNAVSIILANGEQLTFDAVVLATHADQSLGLLQTPTQEEERLLGVWQYRLNPTVLHTDQAVMPPLKTAWASWNYTREVTSSGTSPVSVSYHMNRLQGLKCKQEYFVTLNRAGAIGPECTHKEISYKHPVFSREAVHSQKHLHNLQGLANTYFCGSYFGYGFHEDAVTSAVKIASLLGVEL